MHAGHLSNSYQESSLNDDEWHSTLPWQCLKMKRSDQQNAKQCSSRKRYAVGQEFVTNSCDVHGERSLRKKTLSWLWVICTMRSKQKWSDNKVMTARTHWNCNVYESGQQIFNKFAGMSSLMPRTTTKWMKNGWVHPELEAICSISY